MEIGSRSNSDRGTMSQINVTPLVDVMLVLLVIFMVAAPMMTQGFGVQLPQSRQSKPIGEPVTVSGELAKRSSWLLMVSKRLDFQKNSRKRCDSLFAR